MMPLERLRERVYRRSRSEKTAKGYADAVKLFARFLKMDPDHKNKHNPAVMRI